VRPTAPKHRLITRPAYHAPVGLLSYDTRRWDAWDAAAPSRVCRVIELNPHNAARAAAIDLGVPQWRVRVRPALPERAVIHDAPLQTLGMA
jgi:hypothetical protein